MSKELFFEFRAEEIAYMYDENFSKKQAIQTGIALANKVLDDGLIDPFKVFSNVCRLKEVITAADKEFRDNLDVIEKRSVNGVEFTSIAGRESLNYDEDSLYNDLKEKLEKRKEELDRAKSSKSIEFDIHGCELPKLTSKFTKSSIKLNY